MREGVAQAASAAAGWLTRRAWHSGREPDFPAVESVSLPANFCIIESRETVQARKAASRFLCHGSRQGY